MVLTELDKFSKLHKRILLEGLRAFWETPFRRAWDRAYPGCFGLSNILAEHFGLSRKLLERQYKRRPWARADNQQARARLASPRAALSRTLRHLIACGLVKRAENRRWWRLTPQGIETARALFPEEKERPLLRKRLKEIYETRSGAALGSRWAFRGELSWPEFYVACTGEKE